MRLPIFVASDGQVVNVLGKIVRWRGRICLIIESPVVGQTIISELRVGDVVPLSDRDEDVVFRREIRNWRRRIAILIPVDASLDDRLVALLELAGAAVAALADRTVQQFPKAENLK